MSRRCIYDNWEKLVSAVVKREQVWQLFHQQSRSPSLSSESSGSLTYNFSDDDDGDDDDVDFSFCVLQQDTTVPSPSQTNGCVSVHPSVTTVLPVPALPRTSSIGSRRRSSLVIQVPEVVFRPWNAFDHPPSSSKLSALPTPPLHTTSRIHQRHESLQNTKWPNDTEHMCHPLPLPPSSKTPSPTSVLSPPGSPWKKGKLLARGPLGCVYLGFNSETGEMCAIKEVILHPDDAESKRSAEQLKREIVMLSSLRHPNIVQYYGSEKVDEKLCVYSEYVSGGSIHRILQEYGRLGEPAIRSYTKQMLSGLAYLHSTSTVHRDIKGDTVLVDPNGSVKLAGFGTSKHTIGRFDRLAFEGLPYWMAPEIIRNSNECNPAVDIWSLGCTVLEMASAKPPWSQHGAAVAMFKIGCTKELPTIPDNLSGEGKDFVRLCLQRNFLDRPSAAQLLEHPFVKSSAAAPVEKQTLSYTVSTTPTNYLGIDHARNLHQFVSERPGIQTYGLSHPNMNSSHNGIYPPRNISRPVSQVVPERRSPQHHDGRIPLQPPISVQNTRSSITTAVTGANTYHHQNQSRMQSQRSVWHLPRRQGGPGRNSPTYWDPEIIQGKMPYFPGPGL